MRPPALLLLLLACVVPLAARAADPPSCRGGLFTEDEVPFGLATVTAAPRALFRKDIAPCPDDSDACRAGGYLLPGDTVITSHTAGAYVCAFYSAKTSESVGYLRQAELRPNPAARAVGMAAWTGTWHDGDNSISLRARGGALAASGEAYWPSAHPPTGMLPGGPNVGTMQGQAAPEGNTVTFAGAGPDDCRVKLILLPPFLLAADNQNCGGANVTFGGVYRR